PAWFTTVHPAKFPVSKPPLTMVAAMAGVANARTSTWARTAADRRTLADRDEKCEQKRESMPPTPCPRNRVRSGGCIVLLVAASVKGRWTPVVGRALPQLRGGRAAADWTKRSAGEGSPPRCRWR